LGPSDLLTFDANGNFYGTTGFGGANNDGMVYEFSPSSGGWSESTLFSFPAGSGGSDPFSGVIFDAAGNLYGTSLGGSTGWGLVYELSPGTGGGWTQSVLYQFQGGADGGKPLRNLVFDASGALYGVTGVGGANNLGTVFKLTPLGGSWTESVIHSFTGGRDGSNPNGKLTFDTAGNLYGTTTTGANTTTTICAGLGGCGTVFRMTHGTHWQFSTIYTFQGSRGGNPMGGLVFDPAGNLYGTTLMGGSCRQSSLGCGTVFKLTPSTSGGWKETVLHYFTNDYDGAGPIGLVLDAAGNLFGAASHGGPPTLLCGTVFELTQVSGVWKFAALTQFAGTNDGCFPSGGVTLDASGNVFGVTDLGGTSDKGVVYELSPTGAK
jgi:uncharacterized repeat protein (TIGR03803 family)